MALELVIAKDEEDAARRAAELLAAAAGRGDHIARPVRSPRRRAYLLAG